MKLPLIVGLVALGWGARVQAKPTAPATVRLDERASATGGFDVTLVAVATRAVPSVELAIGDRHATFGATAVGQPRTLTVHLASNAEVHGVARLGGRATLATLHPRLAKPQAFTVRVLPNGRGVAEVR